MSPISLTLRLAVISLLYWRRARLRKCERAANSKNRFFSPQFVNDVNWAIHQAGLENPAPAVRELYRDLGNLPRLKAKGVKQGQTSLRQWLTRRLLNHLPHEWHVAPENGMPLHADGGLPSEEAAKLFAQVILRRQAHPPNGHLMIITPSGQHHEFRIGADHDKNDPRY